jgi:hypothetical protein
VVSGLEIPAGIPVDRVRGGDKPPIQTFGERPLVFMVCAEALVFFGASAFGFLTSRVLRFWPLAIGYLLRLC